MNFKQALNHFIPQITAEMRRQMTPPDGNLDPFYGMLHYHLGWVNQSLEPVEMSAGKRLRPLFTLLACQAAGGNPQKALPAAAAVELAHNFSLIHDDIEDDSDTRRGRATVWSIWGEAQAINAGDALFVLARNALLKLRAQGVPLSTIFEAVEDLDKTTLTLCRGQYLDMIFEQTLTVDLDAYLEMIESKTAALLACSGYLGGLIATDDPAPAEVFRQLGLASGLAFQIQDDILGIWGDEALVGKPAGDDLRNRKKTLPVVFALNHSHPQFARFREIYSQNALTESDVGEAIAILEAIGAKTYAEEKAAFYVKQAQSALQAIDASPERKLALQEMVQFFVERAH